VLRAKERIQKQLDLCVPEMTDLKSIVDAIVHMSLKAKNTMDTLSRVRKMLNASWLTFY
jgi:hypothetical protein